MFVVSLFAEDWIYQIKTCFGFVVGHSSNLLLT
jgi:hypothetical protein